MERKKFLQSLIGTSALLTVPGSKYVEDAYALPEVIRDTNRSVTGSMIGYSDEPIEKVNVGIIGLGNRGSVLLEMFQWLVENDRAEIVALCDVQPKKVEAASSKLANWQTAKPTFYSDKPDDWKKLAQQDNVDLLLICTPWNMHTPMALFGMRNGKHVASEVPIGYSLEDLWNLVETAEETRRHCIMIENCCYNEEELFVLNMINNGVFGDITHTEGAYLHDLRDLMLSDTYYYDYWRLKEHVSRDGNFYTTHGLGPISFYLNIGRGDTFSHLTSMSSREMSLSEAAKDSTAPYKDFKCGDMNTTLIKTELGKTIMLQFDVHTGRPYSRINKVCGTKAVHDGYPSRLYIDDKKTELGHRWLPQELYDEYRQNYMHPIIKKLKTISQGFRQGHGGMDF
ncbi:MAG TPA: acetylgalactosaminidase, partial [Balneolaceae bacterium]|nr:acetylgalactosaminidase [Balneolaceae bacterium]